MSAVVRSGPLTHAQLRWWMRLYWREQGAQDVTWSKQWELPEGIPVAAAERALRALVERHEILRTCFLLGPDGLPTQVVFAADGFRIPVSVAALDTLEEFHRVKVRPLTGGSAYTRPPWSVRLFTEGDEARVVFLAFEHILFDGPGLKNFWAQFLDLCHGRSSEVNATQPLDGQQTETRMLALGGGGGRPDPAVRAPQITVPPSDTDPGERRFLMATGTYQGLLPALDEVCRRHRVSRSAALTFTVGLLLCAYSGQGRLLCWNATSSRLPGDDAVHCASRPLDVLLDLDEGATLGECLEAFNARMFQAYQEELRHGPVPAEARAALAQRRGVGSLRPVYFNFQGASRPADEPARHTDVATRVADHWWASSLEPMRQDIWLYVRGDEVVAEIDIDVLMYPQDTVHTMLRALPEVLLLAAGDPGSTVKDAAALLPEDFPVRTGCRLVGDTWADLAAIERTLTGHPGVLEARALADDGVVAAQVRLADGTGPFDVHEWLLTRLHTQVTLAAPQRYQLGDSVWSPLTDAPFLPAVTEAERELCAAIRETHGHSVDDLALTFAQVGGRVVLVPAVVEALRRRGLSGLARYHFESPYPLRAVARDLVAVPGRLHEDVAFQRGAVLSPGNTTSQPTDPASGTSQAS
ncbi:condensation domain-containing protein [Streptomyces sp. NPDC002677]|uniref:condensation domain-containing protein n=1 Tax=Streptomyces sp. NPDC002677 TaxID=3154774 RepID=UPI00332991C8